MAYRFKDRLAHVGARHQAVAGEWVTYTAGSQSLRVWATPILLSPIELGVVRDPSMLRVDYTDWAIDYEQIKSVYPPTEQHKIRTKNGAEYDVSAMGNDDPCYIHSTTDRNRVIVHSIQTVEGAR
jgi:hypothetical protein